MEINDSELGQFLAGIKTIAIVELSGDPYKYSYQVASYLQSQGYEIIPVQPKVRSVLGRKSVGCLRDIDGRVDLVCVFQPSAEVPVIMDDAIAIGAKGVWLQLGIANPESEQKGRTAGLFVVADRCVKKDHERLLAKAPI